MRPRAVLRGATVKHSGDESCREFGGLAQITSHRKASVGQKWSVADEVARNFCARVATTAQSAGDLVHKMVKMCE
jgi:hypothetical protein